MAKRRQSKKEADEIRQKAESDAAQVLDEANKKAREIVTETEKKIYPVLAESGRIVMETQQKLEKAIAAPSISSGELEINIQVSVTYIIE